MNTIEIQVTDHATPRLQELRVDLNAPALRHAAGGAARRLVSDHLSNLDAARPNVLGGARTHFYARAARAATYDVNTDGATVAVRHAGIAQRYFGGEIRPVNSKWLTIPAVPEAHGKRAREFSFLDILFGAEGRPVALVDRPRAEMISQKKGRKRSLIAHTTEWKEHAGGRVFYWLVKSVSQEPDPEVLPDEQLLADTVTLAILNHIGRS